MQILLGKGWGLNLTWLFLGLFFRTTLFFRDSSFSQEFYLLSLILIPLVFSIFPVRWKSFLLSGKAGFLFILLAVLISFDLQPFFENDFYRYFWEGAALREGYNPYQFSPLDLRGKVEFKYFYGIGYPELSGIYPPVAIILFSLLGIFSFSSGVFLLGLLSAFVIDLVYRDLEKNYISPSILFIVLFTLFREGVVHHHFELLAFFPFWLSLTGGKLAKFLGGFFSFQLKFVGGLSGLNLENLKQKIIFAITLLGSLILFNNLGLFQSSGLEAFREKWLFAPGFINILMAGGISFITAKKISWTLFGIVTLCALILQAKGKKGEMPFLLVLVSFFYFSPVYNSWYSLWPGLTLLLYRNRFGVLYLLLSPLTYLYFTSLKEGVIFANLLVHIGFYFSLYSFKDQS